MRGVPARARYPKNFTVTALAESTALRHELLVLQADLMSDGLKLTCCAALAVLQANATRSTIKQAAALLIAVVFWTLTVPQVSPGCTVGAGMQHACTKPYVVLTCTCLPLASAPLKRPFPEWLCSCRTCGVHTAGACMIAVGAARGASFTAAAVCIRELEVRTEPATLKQDCCHSCRRVMYM
jgi:hypothetical protein